jgi:N-acetyl-gamma-glutamyl-phosphate reductase
MDSSAKMHGLRSIAPSIEVCDHAPALSEVQGTNFCRITIREDKSAGLVKVFSVIDNLVKGSSGQAVQNMNCMFGLAEDQGLGRKV